MFAAASQSHFATAAVVVVTSLIVIAGLIFQTKRKTLIAMSLYAPLLLGIYTTSVYFLFRMGTSRLKAKPR